MNNKKLFIKNEVMCSIIIPVICFVFGFGIKFWFAENAFPVDFEEIDSYEWSNVFLKLYIGFSVLCVIYHAVIVAYMAAKFGLNSQLAWIVYFAISVLISLIAPIYMTFAYREESLCTLGVYILFVLEYVITFLVSTYNCPRHWDFCPFKK